MAYIIHQLLQAMRAALDYIMILVSNWESVGVDRCYWWQMRNVGADAIAIAYSALTCKKNRFVSVLTAHFISISLHRKKTFAGVG